MSTWLANDKMSSALVRRLEASIRGETGRNARRKSHSSTLLLRGFALACVLSICISGYLSFRASEAELVDLRQKLTRQVGATRAPSVRADIAKIEGWLLRAGKQWSGTRNSQDLFEPGALKALQSRPTVYVRASIGKLRTSEGITQAAFESIKDSFLLCLMAPPSSDSEKSLLKSVEFAYQGGDLVNQRTGPVERLHDLLAAAPLSDINWTTQVERAATRSALEQVRRDFLVALAQGAVQSPELLLYVVDEDKDAQATSEFDGASRHKVRVGLVDLKASQELLRISRVVDPSWISEQSRLRYARGLNSCKLGQQTRRSLEAR